jgi:isocitrate dehydrogenase kinase/phosphatase
MDEVDLALLFSANRAYFLVDMEVPSAYVAFLCAIVADKTAAEFYTMVGLQKGGKNLFFRDFLHHLKHSRDKFVIAPGIKGLVMSVFTLPSYPYVFKVIRDEIVASKNTDRRQGQGEVLARQAPRPRRPDDRQPRVFERRLPARPLLGRADRRSSRGSLRRRSSSTATTSSSSTCTSSDG